MGLEEALAQGKLPTERLAPLLRQGLVDTFGEEFQTEGAGTLPRTLFKWEREQEYCDFDAADRAFCKLGIQGHWWGELADLYYNLTFREIRRRPAVTADKPRRCAAVGCNVEFVPHKRNKAQKYCSHKCNARSYARRKRKNKTQRRGKDRALEKLVCRNGHPRTPENTRTNNRGAKVCMICRKEAQHKHRVKRNGGISRQRKCPNCGGIGHYSKSCSMLTSHGAPPGSPQDQAVAA